MVGADGTTQPGVLPVRNGARSSVGGPVRIAWREGTLTRVRELESLSSWFGHRESSGPQVEGLLAAVADHLKAARQAAERHSRRFLPGADAARLQRAMSNLDAAEADLLQVATAEYLIGQVPCLLNHVQRHLPPHDPRRQEFERIAADLGVCDRDRALPVGTQPASPDKRVEIVQDERNRIVSIVRGASSARLREQVSVHSFRIVLIATTVVMLLLAVGLALLGWKDPTTLPLCFQPEQAGRTVVVCPTGQSNAVPAGTRATQPVVDAMVNATVRPGDIAVVEIVGLVAAAVAAAASVRGIRGSSEPHHLPVALALLKLPTGAITAVLGLLLMRGGFVPGLSALDTSAQIVSWAILFGYAQQLFTRLVDQQGHSVLNRVRGTRNADPASRG